MNDHLSNERDRLLKKAANAILMERVRQNRNPLSNPTFESIPEETRQGLLLEAEAVFRELRLEVCSTNEIVEIRTSDMKAAAYYKAAATRNVPPYVPAKVRLMNETYGDYPFLGAGVPAGEYPCECNRYGAVSVIDREGQTLGLRLNQFEPIEWRENAA